MLVEGFFQFEEHGTEHTTLVFGLEHLKAFVAVEASRLVKLTFAQFGDEIGLSEQCP